jgi:protein SCO1/2/putative membrane protein
MSRPRPARLTFVALVAVGLAGCNAPPQLGNVGDFSLTERSGQTVTRRDLGGKVWIAAFVFTRCSTSCPVVSRNVALLQEQFAAYPDIRLVTFSVDPEYDTPGVLQGYAARYGADPERWLFLTGPPAEVRRLVREDFKLYAEPAPPDKREPGNEVLHQSKLVLVDPQGRIRAYAEGARPDELPELARQARLLAWQYRLPGVNACLNATSAVLLTLGYLVVRRRRIALHKVLMLTALVVSTVFLASYLYYHFVVRGGEPTRFRGPDLARYTYLTILLTHTVLAAAVAPLALVTTYLGLRDRLARHVKVARWTLPIWLYVSVTGVVIWWMLYRLYPPW